MLFIIQFYLSFSDMEVAFLLRALPLEAMVKLNNLGFFYDKYNYCSRMFSLMTF